MSDERVIVNADGSKVFKLTTTIVVNKEETDRVTIPAIKGKHLKSLSFKAGVSEVEIGQLVSFAASLVLPKGAVDEMSPEDALAVAAEVAASLNKSAE